MGVFHNICSLFWTISKIIRGSGRPELVTESAICARDSLDQVLNGKHYNCFRVDKLVMEALERFLLLQFAKIQQRVGTISEDTANLLHELVMSPCKETLYT